MSAPIQSECRRCGACCEKGGPALHTQDLPLFRGENPPLETSCLQTLRTGEPAFDQPAGVVRAMPHEAVKLRPKSGGDSACLFFLPDGSQCGIYASRPLECRTLACWQPESLAAIYDKGRLRRADILPPGSVALELAMEHERQCSWQALDHALQIAVESPSRESETAVLDIISRDDAWRQELASRLQAESREVETLALFLFGRPMHLALSYWGVRLVRGVRQGHGLRLLRLPRPM